MKKNSALLQCCIYRLLKKKKRVLYCNAADIGYWKRKNSALLQCCRYRLLEKTKIVLYCNAADIG